jgi:hypothetical protein
VCLQACPQPPRHAGPGSGERSANTSATAQTPRTSVTSRPVPARMAAKPGGTGEMGFRARKVSHTNFFFPYEMEIKLTKSNNFQSQCQMFLASQ